jgi:hypothetical protein
LFCAVRSRVVCAEAIRVNTRINSVETGEVLDTGKGTAYQVDQGGLDQAVFQALGGLKAKIQSYVERK